MKPFFLTTATALAAVLSVPAMAQDHADHADHAAMPAAAPPEEVDHATMDHSHGLLPAIEAPAPDHSAMGHAMAEGRKAIGGDLLTLHATTDGMKTYEKMGFSAGAATPLLVPAI